MRYEYLKEMEKLNNNVIKMGMLIEQSIDDTIDALVKQDVKLAQEVIDKDDEIDNIERYIEQETILLIARQQPIASDLRTIASVMKIITDLERIADHCSDISQYTIKLASEKYVKPLVHIPEMANQVKLMVCKTIDSYIKSDLKIAREVIETDAKVNNYFHMIVDELSDIMQSNSQVVPQCIDFIFIVKYLERMGDHSTNIAEWIEYIITGDLK